MEMNNTAEQEIIEQFSVLLPSFVFICILITVGIPGNILAIIVYGFKLKTTTGRYAIVSLAICDVVNCVLSIPVELFVMTRYWHFEHAALCKMSRFLTYAMNNSSALILLAIAVERYRAICNPHKPKISSSCIFKACVTLIIVGFIIALPALWIYGIQTDAWLHGNILKLPYTVNTEYNNTIIHHSDSNIVSYLMSNKSAYKYSGTQIVTKRCLMDDRFRQTWFAYSHFGFVTIASEIILVILIGIYIQIGRKIYGLRNMGSCSADEESMRRSAKRKKQATLVLFLITLAFEFTFLPFTIITNIRFFTEPAWYNNLSNAGKMAYHFFLRSYYFNNAVNPFIYCVSCGNFRSALFKLFQTLKQKVRNCCNGSEIEF
ncbi:G-protein coupled receptor 83-like [Ruditapes philippinarum]|uniref:G-protein coupled receptor 83-like n=1 Tax=Ruditapes philippinarum TaxID=129788 RepID=UPI00295BD3CE|nr:G-protein coupled receptor 83-like [Ruditapes philippinarum]